MIFKPQTPVCTPHGLARVEKFIRKYGVYMLDRKSGPYWTYPQNQLREPNANELSRLMTEEGRMK